MSPLMLSIILYSFGLLGLQAKDQCQNNEKCWCNFDGEYEYQCPNKNHKLVIRARTEDYLQLDCTDMITFDVDLLPDYKSGKTPFVYIQSCPLPNDNFIPMLKTFNISNIEYFSLVNVSIPSNSSTGTISKTLFRDLNNVNELTISRISDKLDDDLLENFDNLTKFYLSNSYLDDLENFTFPITLTRLEVSQSNVATVPKGIFKRLKKLSILHLWQNQIAEIRRKDFAGLTSLTSLELSSNRISSIEENSFSDLKELQKINLRNNLLGEINLTLFANNKKLQNINLGDNLNLILHDKIFAGLTSLLSLNLKNSKIAVLPERLFENLSKLKNLELQRNDIAFLPDDIFADLTALETLNLNDNNLAAISGSLFKKTTNLRSLSISYNKLSTFEQGTFTRLDNLKTIDLSNNFMKLPYGQAGPLSDLHSLETMILSQNGIQDIPTLTSFLKLAKLDLSYNNITSVLIGDEFVDPISPSLDFVDLTNNRIEYVYFSTAIPLFNPNNNRKQNDTRIDLRNNPIKCDDCKVYDLVRYLQQNLSSDFGEKLEKVKLDLNDVECAVPESHSYVNIMNLMPSSVSCERKIDIKNCPNECKCNYRPSNNFLEVNCSNRNLTYFPKLNVSEKNYYEGIHMNLEGNFIQGGLSSKFGYEKVKELLLSNNKLHELKWIPSGIEILQLDHNKLTHLDTDLLQILEKTVNLESIQLSDNPWECECSALDFQIFLKKHYQKVKSDVVCNSDHKFLIKKIDLCKSNSMLIIILPVVVFLLLTVISLILYIYYRQEVKVWLYSKNLCLWFVTEDELDEDKMYDIFISYSNQDEEFVMQNLLPVLESGPKPFKTCIHIRDWEPGEMILTHVTNSVLNSRRTLVVLSNNFLDSVWGIQEFKTAHMHAIKEGRARVVVVKYGDIDESRLDQDIKAYLSTNTYVEWGKPWFWNKLKFALPHSQRKGFYKANQKHANIMSKIDDKFELASPPLCHSESTPPVATLDPASLKHHPFHFIEANAPEIPLVVNT